MQVDPNSAIAVASDVVVQVRFLKAIAVLIVQVGCWFSAHGVGGNIVHGAASTNVYSDILDEVDHGALARGISDLLANGLHDAGVVV